MDRRGFLGLLGAAPLAAVAALHAYPVQRFESAPLTVEGGDLFQMGDVFTIAGVYSVNPTTGAKSNHLQQFVITADVKHGASEAKIHPTMHVGPTCQVSQIVPVLMGQTTCYGSYSGA